ncbi:group 3 secretory phospholipase A2 [Drosophila ficusphila]|uniref:group 3 secretory phospholipase A2 n=1 Tax=Drosophila ficusphila TaxID=30025 RepID=UPI001C891583|nr:group 3 secretory phospholipase A2 [Drosophila ficusphila]
MTPRNSYQCERVSFDLAAVGEHIKRQCFSDWQSVTETGAPNKKSYRDTMRIARQSNATIYVLISPLVILAAWQLLCVVPGTNAKHLAVRSYDPQKETAAESQIQTQSVDDAPVHRHKRQLSDWLIAPNTRWCGRGNLANGTYNDLGGASKADKCCRKHDHCKMWIDGMSNRYDLFNYRPYTLSHCSCDLRFRTCLKMAGDEDANAIGKLFFNVVQTQCFGLKMETVCVQRGGSGKDSDPCLKEEVRHKAFLRNNKRF